MIRRLATVLLLALAALSCASGPDLDEDQSPRSRYSGQAGESAVGVIPEASLRDDARGKDIAMAIDYPQRAGSYPLVLFSPAYGRTHRDYVGLSAYWTSQGYVVVRLSHADSNIAQPRPGEPRPAPDAWLDQTPADWRNRVRDVTFVLDSLAKLTERYPELTGKIDATKIGVGGHGYGAFTAMLLGGTRTFPGAASYADPRVKAIVAMSPQGVSEARGLTAQSWAELRLPALFMAGSLDAGATEAETAEWRRQGFENAPAGDKWLVILEGAGHGTFTGRRDQFATSAEAPIDLPTTRRNPDPLTRPPDDPRRPGRESTAGLSERNRFADVKAISLAFWDTYLRAEAEGRTTLEAAGSRGGVELVKK